MAGREGWGAALGSAAGTALGSFLGPIGGAFGAGIGGLAGNAFQGLANRNNPQYGKNGNFFTGNPAGYQQSTPYADWQIPHFQQAAQMGLQNIQNPYNGFEPIENLARSNFQNKTIPTLAHRFASMGDAALSSPVYHDINSQAGKDLELGLAALRAEYGMQNQNNGLRMLQFGNTPLYQNQWTEGSPGLMSLLGPEGAGPAIGRLGANAFGAYLGAQPGQGWNAANSAVINGLRGM